MDDIEERLDRVEERLVQVINLMEELDRKLDTLTKHAPFVDKLASSGAVKAISSLNTVFSSLNPMRYIAGSNGVSIENV